MTDKDFSIDTKLIHAGEPNPRIKGAVSMPIFQSSNPIEICCVIGNTG